MIKVIEGAIREGFVKAAGNSMPNAVGDATGLDEK
jgi:hypothetical protein